MLLLRLRSLATIVRPTLLPLSSRRLASSALASQKKWQQTRDLSMAGTNSSSQESSDVDLHSHSSDVEQHEKEEEEKKRLRSKARTILNVVVEGFFRDPEGVETPTSEAWYRLSSEAFPVMNDLKEKKIDNDTAIKKMDAISAKYNMPHIPLDNILHIKYPQVFPVICFRKKGTMMRKSIVKH